MADLTAFYGKQFCTECFGTGKKRKYGKRDINPMILEKKPEPFDLDCCIICEGKGTL